MILAEGDPISELLTLATGGKLGVGGLVLYAVVRLALLYRAELLSNIQREAKCAAELAAAAATITARDATITDLRAQLAEAKKEKP